MDQQTRKRFKEAVLKELRENILPFWMKKSVDHSYGGFFGRVNNDLQAVPEAPKGLILNTRILWTFSTLYCYFNQEDYLDLAQRSFDYLIKKFFDKDFGGYYWMLDYRGEPIDTKKNIYGQAFVIYAFTEYSRAIKDQEPIHMARDLFNLLESKCRDNTYGGYFEAFNRNWKLAEEHRLSDKDMDEIKSMNAHLHMLEAYTNLYRVWKAQKIKKALKRLIEVFQNHIIDSKTHCFKLFFDEMWCPKTNRISFGHDIEGSWLLTEAANVLEDPLILKSVNNQVIGMVEAVHAHGLDSDGGLLYEGDSQGIIDTDKHWWPQAEAVIGFLNSYKLTGEQCYLDSAFHCWKFIEKYIVDRKYGEWFWKVSRQGKPYCNEYKVSEWKGPYHNVRTCLEILQRLD